MAWSARPFGANLLQQIVTMPSHGFDVGSLVINSAPNTWIAAKADLMANCAGTWMVCIKIDANNFVVCQEGYVTSIVNGAPFADIGKQYYLDIAGGLTTTRPNISNQIILPCFVPDTATSGFFYGGSGFPVETSGAINTVNETGDITLVANTRYFLTPASSPQNLQLPTLCAEGDILILNSFNLPALDQILVTQINSQSVVGLGGSTTPGNTGGILITDNFSSTTLVCQTGGTDSLWFLENTNGPNIEFI